MSKRTKEQSKKRRENEFKEKKQRKLNSVAPQTENQEVYVTAICNSTITFGIGPAGCGKTFIPTSLAALALLNNTIEKIILVRPAIEAGEKLGFLPGNIYEKIDPYMRPIFDILTRYMEPQQITRYIEMGMIEIAPLAYMRGRSIPNAFIILDEAQNVTATQMKMFLTRIGENSKIVITGDTTQCDLPRNVTSGLLDAVNRLDGISDITVVKLNEKDIVRHDIIQKIIEAYEQHT